MDTKTLIGAINPSAGPYDLFVTDAVELDESQIVVCLSDGRRVRLAIQDDDDESLYDAFPNVKDYSHLSSQQQMEIRQRATEIYAAGDGLDDVPGTEPAKVWVGTMSISELLAWDTQIGMGLDFDLATGKPK